VIPLVPFVIIFAFGLTSETSESFVYSVVFTSVAFFLIGIIKGKIVKKPLLRSGVTTLLVGGIAAAAAYLVGSLLGNLVKI